MYVRWDKPRRWAVRLYTPHAKTGYSGYHVTMGIVALSVTDAILAAQEAHPKARIESVNDTGAVDLVVHAPEFTVAPEVNQ